MAVLAIAGCGGGDNGRSDGNGEPLADTQSLVVAAAAAPETLDPLTTNTADGLEIARQIFEPLTGSVKGAQSNKRIDGLVISWQKSVSGRVWLARLRKDIKFQDGTRLDARAVVVNARRWRTSPANMVSIGAQLRKVTAPRSTLVRFSLREPESDLPSKLASPHLGLVSPKALDPPSGREAKVTRVKEAGSGPFKLDSASKKKVVLLANEGWWARSRGISPLLGKVTFIWEPDQERRIASLKSNRAQLATGLDHAGFDQLAKDPNVQVLGMQDGSGYASALWLRGINLSKLGASSLAPAWITSVHS